MSSALANARLSGVIPAFEIALASPVIEQIEQLKRDRNAIVLAHNYMTPDIFHGVADLKGDSLALARLAANTDADVIVLAGVHFMAETVKIVNPDRTVLTPDPAAGCSLAESINSADVRQLRERYPGVPIVTYVNTSAEVKAESDICCTSGNAVQAAEPDIVMLDNMDIEVMRAAVELVAGACIVEASGGITEATIRQVAETGVDVISVGWITHSAPALDFALKLFRPEG